MQRLSGLDATFLYLETPSSHLHVAMAAVFDPSTVEGGYSYEKVKDLMRSRLHALVPYRRRLVEVPFQLHHPLWIEDPDFDLDYHMHRVAVPSPGGPKEFADIAGDIIGRPLDRNHPLWEIWVVEGLEHGNIGVISKVHHSTIDGVSGAELLVHLFDLEPTTALAEVDDPWKPDKVPNQLELVAYALNSRLRRPFQIMGMMPRTVRAVANVVSRARERANDPNAATPAAPLTAPPTPFNAAITPHRNIAFTSVSLDDVKKVKNAMGTTVNDVIVSVCGGGLRRYLERKEALPDKPLIGTVPISVRTDEQVGTMGNRVSAMFTALGTDVADPVERLMKIHEVNKAAKDIHKAVGATMLQDWAEFASPTVFARASRLYSRMRLADRHRPIHNLVISNVPGPPFPLYFAGARLVALYPLGPIFEGAALNITVMSYVGSVDFGLVGCPEVIPDLWDLAADIDTALDELVKATT